jgi:hypothetical protein
MAKLKLQNTSAVCTSPSLYPFVAFAVPFASKEFQMAKLKLQNTSAFCTSPFAVALSLRCLCRALRQQRISNGKTQIAESICHLLFAICHLPSPYGAWSSRNAQPAAQGKLQPGHFALIGFVVVAQQVQEAVQDQPADLIQG